MRRARIDLKVNHERWLVSYADFITLMFAFFVVMYSISQVNEAKYKELSTTLEAVFTNESKSLEPIQIGDPIKSQRPSIIDGEVKGEDQGQGNFSKLADLPQLESQLETEFSDLIEDELVTIDSNELWLKLELKSGILFSSGGATPNEAARSVFEDIASLLKGFDNVLQVEGFTDNQPINTARFPSNWELSAARSASIVKLLAEFGVRPERMSAVGYGQYQPVDVNTTAAGRANNRRVVVMVARRTAERLALAVTDAMDLTRVNQRAKDISRSALSRAQDRAAETEEIKRLAQQALLREIEKNTAVSEADSRPPLTPEVLESGEIRYSGQPQ